MGTLPVRRPRRGRAGFTIADVLIATAIMTVAIGGLTGAVVSSMRLNEVNEETAIADDGARRMAEELRTVPFNQIFANFDGFDFEVVGLTAQDGDPDGLPGEVRFPTLGGLLSENVNDPSLGMPRDLDLDGELVPDPDDHSADYRILPVTIRIDWTGESGERFLEYDLLLTE